MGELIVIKDLVAIIVEVVEHPLQVDVVASDHLAQAVHRGRVVLMEMRLLDLA